MRPVYVAPAPVATTPCPTPAAPVAEEPALGEPAAGEVSVPSGEVSVPAVGPSASPPSAPVPGPSASPRATSPGQEPPLELAPSATVPKDSGSTVPQLQAPKGASSSSSLRGSRRDVSGRPRQASLRQQVRPFVNDPDGLFSPPKADRPWKYVVLHHSAKPAGNYDEIDREHRKVLGWDGCGYHFVIGNGKGSADGQIEVARRWTEQKQGVHCRNGKTAEVNEYGIGICLVGDFDQAPPTPKQIASARALVAYLSERYQVPTSRVETHAHVASTPTLCPGKHFPAQAIVGSGSLVQR